MLNLRYSDSYFNRRLRYAHAFESRTWRRTTADVVAVSKGRGWEARCLTSPHSEPETRPRVNTPRGTIVLHTQYDCGSTLNTRRPCIHRRTSSRQPSTETYSHIFKYTRHDLPDSHTPRYITATHSKNLPFNMGKPKGRKIPNTFFVRVKMNGCDQRTVNRLYRERDTRALDSMGAKVYAFPSRCFKNTAVFKPQALQDKRCWRETKPKAPSSLREHEVASE